MRNAIFIKTNLKKAECKRERERKTKWNKNDFQVATVSVYFSRL